jgi:nucleoside phosphorylase
MKKILICAPLARELKYVLSNFPAGKRGWTSGGFFSVETTSGEVVLLRTGIGIHDSESSLATLLGELRPDLIVSLGFAGALYEGLAAGDLIWASRVFFLSDRTSDTEGPELPEIPLPESKRVADRLAGIISLREGCIVTLEDLKKKPEIRKRLPAGVSFPVCDMETFVLARTATRQGIPFFAARSISDASDHEIPLELLDIFDESGKILYFRLSKSVLYKPGLAMDMVRLRRNSEMAAKSLGSLVRAIMSHCLV